MRDLELRFGTDGIRGRFAEGLLTADAVERLGIVLADWLQQNAPADRPVLLGGDTRSSREELTRALAAGLARRGVRSVDLGVMPTTGIALLAGREGAPCAMVISASHNPAADNGVKVFARGTEKLGDEDSRWIERRWATLEDEGTPIARAAVPVREEAGEAYLDLLLGHFPGLDLCGMKIALDLANGAAFRLAPELFRRLGAEVVTMADTPTGININDGCGSLHPERLCALVREQGALFGVGFDGDADRSLFVSEAGERIDGDEVLALIATDLAAAGTLAERTVVGTLMTNYGLEMYLRERDIALERTQVGDRFISATMRERGLSLGGEPSGHLIFGDRLHYLGDGPYTALRVAEYLRRTGTSLARALAGFALLPQTLIGVRVEERSPLDQLPGLKEKLARAEESLCGSGRVVVRYSGTEPLVRIMVEAADPVLVDEVAKTLTQFLTEKLGGS